MIERMSFLRITFLMGAIAFSLLLQVEAIAQSAGHRVSGNQVTISGRSQWDNWSFPDGTAVISPTGEVRAQKIEKQTNAVSDIVEYLRYNPPASIGKKEVEDITLADAIKGGSNVENVANVFDGDLSTYWEPEEPSADRDLASQWWFVADLGRVVFAEKIVVRFAEEEIGDPFLLFEVLVSDGLKPARLQGGDDPAFTTVLRTLSENKTQRVFEIDLTRVQPLVDAAPVRFVQILVTGTNGLAGREVSKEDYDLLSDDLRGAVEYYKRQPDGREVVVEEDLYSALDDERRGSIRYYRRERPRLAEVEVWNKGDELVSGIYSRGGEINTTTTQPLALRKFFDGDLETFNRIFYSVASAVANPDLELVFDLGSFYWIDTYRLAYNRGMFPSYRIDFSDGSLAPDGSLQWIPKATVGTPRPSARYEGAEFEPIKARFGRFQWTLDAIGARNADMSELQFYGEGFQPEVSLTSDLIRLGGSRNLLSIQWDADTPPGTQVQIQTRTGNELGEILHYYKSDGSEVSEADYGRLLSIFKGDIIAEQVPGSDWSDWSEPYTISSGSVITSPSPREFLSIRATLLSDDPEQSAALRSIRLDFSSPVAQNVLGEVSPFRVEELGVRSPFSFYIAPQFASRDPGFDELLLMAPPNMDLELVNLYGGRLADFSDNADADLVPLEFDVIPTQSDSLHLRFASVRPRGAIEVLRLDFETSLFVTGAVLKSALRNSSQTGGGSWQRVDPGDAIGSVMSNTTTVVSSVTNNSLLTDVEVVPPIFSPNGDGINEEVNVSFNVVRVGDDSPVKATISDLSGRVFQTILEERRFSTGAYTLSWNGRDGAGRRVPPGVYLMRLEIDTDTEGADVKDAVVMRHIAVAY